MEFKDLLVRISTRFPSKKAFAAELDIDPSRLTRAINTGDFPFNIENCLKLARLSGESPSEILRAAGKGDIADLIESLYGKDRTQLLSAPERDLLREFEVLTPRARQALRTLLADLTASKTRPRKQRRAVAS